MEYINRFLQRTKSGGGAPKAKTGFRPDPLLDNKGDFGEDSFQSDKGDQLSECSFTSALTKVLDTDTDTTAEYESASETEGSPSSPAGDTTCTTLSGGDITVVAGPGGSGDHDLSMLANDMGGLYLSTPCTSKHRKRGGIGAGDADDFYHVIESVTPKENGLSPRSPTTLSPILPKPRLLSESEAISDMLERSFSEAFPDCPDTREELEAAVAVGPCDSLTDSIDTIDSQEGLHLSSRQDGENLNRSENKSFFLNNSRGVNSLEALFHGLTMQDSKAVAESIQKNSVSEWVNGTEGVSLLSNAESPERLTSPGRDLSRISEENYDSLQDYARPTKATDQLNVQVPNDVSDSTTAEEILKIVNQSEDQNSTFEVIQENIELSQIKSPGQTSQNVTQLPETLEYCESVIKSSSNIVEDSLEGIVPIERQSGVGEAVSKELCYESPVKAEITSEGLVSYDSGSETERSLSSPIMDPTDTLPSGSDVTFVGSGGNSDLSMLANMMGGFYLSTPCSARKREKVVEDANTSYIVTESVSPIKENGKSPRSQMSPIPFASRIECLEVVPKELPSLEPINSLVRTEISVEESIKASESFEIQVTSSDSVVKESSNQDSSVQSSINISDGEIAKSPTKMSEAINHEMPNTPEPTESQMKEFPKTLELTKSSTKPAIFSEEQPKVMEPSEYASPKEVAKEIPSVLEPVESSIEISVSGEEPKPEETCKSPTKICEFLNHSQEFSEISKHTKSPVKPEIFAEELPKAVESQHTASEDGAKEMPSSLEPVEIESSIEISVSREEPKPEETCKSPTKICEFLNRSQEFSEILKHTKSPVKPEIFAEEVAKEIPSAPEVIQSSIEISVSGKTSEAMSRSPSNIYEAVSHELPKTPETFESLFKMCEVLPENLPEVPKSIEELVQASEPLESPVDIALEPVAKDLPKDLEPLVSEVIATESVAKEIAIVLELKESPVKSSIVNFEELSKPEEVFKSPTKISEVSKTPEPIETQIESLSVLPEEVSKVLEPTKSPAKAEILAVELPKIMEPTTESQLTASDIFVEPKAEEPIENLLEESKIAAKELSKSLEPIEAIVQKSPQASGSIESKPLASHIAPMELSEALVKTESPVKDKTFVEESSKVLKSFDIAPEVVANGVPKAQELFESQVTDFEMVAKELPKIQEGIDNSIKTPVNIDESKTEETLKSPAKIHEIVNHELPKSPERIQSQIESLPLLQNLPEVPYDSPLKGEVFVESFVKAPEPFGSPIITISEVVNQELSKTPEHIKIKDGKDICMDLSEVPETTKTATETEIFVEKLPKAIEPTESQHTAFKSIFNEIPKVLEPAGSPIEIPIKEEAKPVESFKMSEVVKHALAKYSESLDWSLPKPLDVIDGRVSSVVDRDTVKRQHDKALSDLMATAHKQEIELELAIATPDDDLARPITSADDFDIKFDPSFTEEAERLAIDVLNSSKSLTDESDSDDGKWGKTTPQADLEEHIFMPKSMVGQTEGARSLQCMMRPAASPDINRSEAGPVTADEHFHQGEDAFQDAASFDFEYLAKVGRGTGGHSLARQSLFVKFDPLVNNQANPSVKTMNESIDTEEEEKMASETGGATPKKMLDGLVDQQPVQRLISVTPPRTETPTKTRTMANSPATPTLRQDILSKEISKLQELMMQQEQSYQEQLTSRTEEVEDLRKRVDELETREPREDLEEKLKASEAKTAKLKKELAENALGKKQLTMIMEEYEKTISQLVTKREDEKKEFEQVKETIAGERDMALQHLSNMEVAFNDIHQKYEKAKAVIESMKINEQLLKESLAENEKTIKKQEGDYQKLKKHASEKLEVANKELLGLRKAHQAEVAKLRAIAKKSEIKVKSLEESLEQKNKEVRELTQICDELIDKVENH